MIVNKYNNGGGGSGSGSTVSWRQDLSAGTQIARITINGTSQNVYAPAGGSVDLSGYTTTAVTAELSAATSGIAVGLETLSAYTATISGSSFGILYSDSYLNGLSADDREVELNKIRGYASAGTPVFVWTFSTTFGSSNFRLFKLYGYNSGNVFFCCDEGETWSYMYYYRTGRIIQNNKKYLPTATDSVLGGIKVGSGLSIDNNGVLSVSGGGSGTTTTVSGYTYWSVPDDYFDGVQHLVTAEFVNGEPKKELMVDDWYHNLNTYMYNIQYNAFNGDAEAWARTCWLKSREMFQYNETLSTNDSSGYLAYFNPDFNYAIYSSSFNLYMDDVLIGNFASWGNEVLVNGSGVEISQGSSETFSGITISNIGDGENIFAITAITGNTLKAKAQENNTELELSFVPGLVKNLNGRNSLIHYNGKYSEYYPNII